MVKKAVHVPYSAILAPVPEGDDLEGHKVSVADQKRAVEHHIGNAHLYAEALTVAGVAETALDDLELIAIIAAVPADGASGSVGVVTAAKIAAAIKGHK